MELPSDAYLNWFDRMGQARPTHLSHGVIDTYEKPLSEQLVRLKCTNWRLEGNQLSCDTEQGPLSQTIDPGYICTGTSPEGLPILTKIQAK